MTVGITLHLSFIFRLLFTFLIRYRSGNILQYIVETYVAGEIRIEILWSQDDITCPMIWCSAILLELPHADHALTSLPTDQGN